MNTLSAVIQTLLFVLSLPAMLYLVKKWGLEEHRKKYSEAWGYLKCKDNELLDLHKKFTDTITSGKRKPAYFRSIEAIKEAMEMRYYLIKNVDKLTSIKENPSDTGN